MQFGFQTFIINLLALSLFLILISLAFVIGDRLILDGRFTGGYNKTQRIKDLVEQLNDEKISLFQIQAQKEDLKRSLNQSRLNTEKAQQQLMQTLAGIPSYQFILSLQKAFRNNPNIQIIQGRVCLNTNLLFAENTFVLTDALKESLDQVARTLINLEETAPNLPWTLQISGHTTPQRVPQESGYGSNWKLSYKRAFGALQYLISKGIRPERLYISSFSQYQSDSRLGGNYVSFRFDYR